MSFFKALFKPKNNSNSPKIDKSSSSPNLTEQQQDNKNYKSTSTYSPYTLQSQENNNQNDLNNNSSSDEQHSSFSSSFKLYPDYYHPGNEQQSSHNNESLMFMQSFASGFDIMGGSGVTPPSPTTNIKQYRSKRASSNGSTNSSGSNNNTTPLASSHPHYNTNSNNIGPIGASPRKANQLHPQSINVHYHYCGQCDSCLMAKYSKNPFTELTMLNQLDNRDDFNTSVNGNNNNASEFQNVVLLYDRNINLNWNYSKLIPHYLNYFNSIVSNNVITPPTPINTTPTKLNNHNSTFQNYLNTFNNYFYLNEEYLFYKSRETTTYHNNHQQNHMSCMIASGDYDGRIVLWDVAKGIKISTLKGHRLSVTCLSPIFLQVKKPNESRLQYSPFAQYLLTGSGDKSIKLWNISQIWEQSSNSLHNNQHPMINISCERTMEGHKSSIRCIEVLQDGTPRFCSSANDGKICLWNWLTGELLQVIERDEGSIMNALSSSLFFTINNAIITKNPVSPILTRTLLITNSADKSSLYLYNIKENAEKDNNICENSETHDENHLISHCFDDNLSFKSPILSVFKILNQSEGQVYNMNINSDTDSNNNNVIYSCDHNFILSVATSDGEITLNRCYYKEGKWILKPIVTIQRAAKQNNKNDKVPKVYRHCYQMLINNSFLAVALDQDIFIFDISTAISQLVTSDSSEIICPTILEFLNAHDDKINCIISLHHGHVIASCSKDGTIKIWSTLKLLSSVHQTKQEQSESQSNHGGGLIGILNSFSSNANHLVLVASLTLHAEEVKQLVAITEYAFVSFGKEPMLYVWKDTRIERRLRSYYSYQYEMNEQSNNMELIHSPISSPRVRKVKSTMSLHSKKNNLSMDTNNKEEEKNNSGVINNNIQDNITITPEITIPTTRERSSSKSRAYTVSDYYDLKKQEIKEETPFSIVTPYSPTDK